MKILVAGAGGQLGRALVAAASNQIEIIAPPEAEFDVTDPACVSNIVEKFRCDALVNAAAYTQVDRAEQDEATALRINAEAVGFLAAAAAAANMKFAHVSTDFVFDGSASTPYAPDAPPNPLSAYGRTKCAGEEAALAAHPNPLIVRTAWVYAAEGANFVRTMLRLMNERETLSVVADQIGTPTHATTLARTILDLLANGRSGVWHCTDAGVASWYDFAVAIHEEGRAAGLVSRDVQILPIRTEDYPTPARRPAYAVLDKTKTWSALGPARHWREELRNCMKAMKP